MLGRIEREDALRRHLGFAQRLAHSLVVDPHGAEDAAQNAWVAALERPPRQSGSLRAYLSTILRRGLARTARDEERRREREALNASSERVASSAELSEAMEAHRLVVDALLELDEKSREVLLLRYFEDLPPRTIAARLGIAVETVRTRHRRALAKIRGRLEERDGQAFRALAFLALPGAGEVAKPAAIPLLTFMSAGKLAAGVAAALVLCLVLVQRLLPDPTRGPATNSPDDAIVDLSFEADTDLESPRSTPTSPPALERGEVSTGPDEVTQLAPLDQTGHLIVVEEDRGELHEEHGVLRAGFDGESLRSIEIVAGSFPLPASFEEFRFDGVRVGERAMRVVDPLQWVDGIWVLRVAPPPIFTLHVIDAVTGGELQSVLMLMHVLNAGSGPFPNNWQESHVHARNASSPVQLSSTFPIARYWFHATGYTWQSVRLDHSAGGERRVALEPIGGNAQVVLEGAPIALPAEPDGSAMLFLRAYDAEGAPYASRHASKVEVMLHGLAAGTYVMRLELGSGAGAIVIDEAEVAIEQAQETRVELRYSDPEDVAQTATLAGVVHAETAEPGWTLNIRRHGTRLRENDEKIWSADTLKALHSRAGVYQVPPLEVTQGTYTVSLPGRWAEQTIEVGPDGASFELEHPRLAAIKVLSIDGATGEPLPLRRLGYRRSADSGQGWIFGAPESTEFDLKLPYGSIVFLTPSEGVNWAEDVVDIHSANQTVELRSRPRAGFRLQLLDGETPVPPGASTKVRVITSLGTREFYGYHTGDAWYVIDRPGLIRVEMDAVPGYRPIPAQELLVTWEGPNELVIPLLPIDER